MLTQEQKREYVNTKSGNCPYCGSGEITGRGYDYDDEPSQVIDCEACGRSWMDVFTLADILEMNDEGEIIGEATPAEQPKGMGLT